MNKRQDRILTIVLWVLLAVSAAPLLHYGRRALIADRFVIKGVSMEPTLHTGQGVWVNKLLMGQRSPLWDWRPTPSGRTGISSWVTTSWTAGTAATSASCRRSSSSGSCRAGSGIYAATFQPSRRWVRVEKLAPIRKTLRPSARKGQS
mgnify:CR=1 FL=1